MLNYKIKLTLLPFTMKLQYRNDATAFHKLLKLQTFKGPVHKIEDNLRQLEQPHFHTRLYLSITLKCNKIKGKDNERI